MPYFLQLNEEQENESDGNKMTAIQAAVIVVLGGLFGWTLGKLPDRWVYVVAAISIVAALIVFGR